MPFVEKGRQRGWGQEGQESGEGIFQLLTGRKTKH